MLHNLCIAFSRACVQISQCTYYGGCGENEYWNECGSECKEDKCADLLNPYVNPNDIIGSKTCSAACTPRCQCRPGFFRNDDGKTILTFPTWSLTKHFVVMRKIGLMMTSRRHHSLCFPCKEGVMRSLFIPTLRLQPVDDAKEAARSGVVSLAS